MRRTMKNTCTPPYYALGYPLFALEHSAGKMGEIIFFSYQLDSKLSHPDGS